nr:hypothetical protein [Lachnospiraceae bacterium]
MRRVMKFLAIILVATLTTGLFASLGTEATSKPDVPVISLNVTKKGTAIKIVISKTTGAKGFIIYMKSDSDLKYKKIKTLKKDGSIERSYTVKNLKAGSYSFKAVAYTKNGKKTVKSGYSNVKQITLGKDSENAGKSDIANNLSRFKTG